MSMTTGLPNLTDDPRPGPGRTDPLPARDLLDFHLRWPEFRPLVLDLLARDRLSPAERQTLRSLVDLADRVREDDLLN